MRWYEKLFIRVLKTGRIPKSIAFIMDGNRRFATNKAMQKHEGHSFGLNKLQDTLEWCLELGIKEVTVFALSTDNLSRSQVELDTLFKLIKVNFAKMVENEGFFQKNGIQIKILGNTKLLPEDVQKVLKEAEQITEKNKEAKLNICVCYNSKHEILEAVD